jgi:hypothetical protein
MRQPRETKTRATKKEEEALYQENTDSDKARGGLLSKKTQ